MRLGDSRLKKTEQGRLRTMREGGDRGHGDSGGESASTRGEGRGNRDRDGREGESRWKKQGRKEGVRNRDESWRNSLGAGLN